MESSTDDMKRILQQTRTIAVYWANPRREAPAWYVPAYLHDAGYRVFPVHVAPVHQGIELFGEPMRRSLLDIPVPIDMILVFQVPEALPYHVDRFLEPNPLPRAIWFQQGIRHDAVAARLRSAGIEVVQDACAMVVHRLQIGVHEPPRRGETA